MPAVHLNDLYTTLPSNLPLYPGEPTAYAYYDAWDLALQGWLETFTNSRCRAEYRRALGKFLSYVQRWPWQVEKIHFELWSQLGMMGETSNSRREQLIRVRSFYRYAHQQATWIGPHGLPIPLLETNPAQDLPLPPRQEHKRVRALHRYELQAYLGAFDRDTPFGARDYAIAWTILETGMGAEAVRLLTYQQIEHAGGMAWLTRVKAGGKHLANPYRVEMTTAWEAIQAYLELSGELEDIQETHHSQPLARDYLFRPIEDLTGLLRQAHPLNWDKRPLSYNTLRRNIRRYAEWAGLEKGLVTITTLRYTGLLMKLRPETDLWEVADFLGLRSTARARAILRRLRRQHAYGWNWRLIMELIAIPPVQR
jgi:site-specific recombinase XerD